MVCESPRLAVLDRELNHAYFLAVRAGVSQTALRRTQDRWVMNREASARSVSALVQYYRQRIAQLRAMASPHAVRRGRRH